MKTLVIQEFDVADKSEAWGVSKKNGRTVELGGGRKITVPACLKDPPQAWRDAKLIAAAPDLLKALQVIVATLPHIGGNERSVFSLLKDANNAIAKVESSAE